MLCLIENGEFSIKIATILGGRRQKVLSFYRIPYTNGSKLRHYILAGMGSRKQCNCLDLFTVQELTWTHIQLQRLPGNLESHTQPQATEILLVGIMTTSGFVPHQPLQHTSSCRDTCSPDHNYLVVIAILRISAAWETRWHKVPKHPLRLLQLMVRPGRPLCPVHPCNPGDCVAASPPSALPLKGTEIRALKVGLQDTPVWEPQPYTVQ